MTLEDFKDVFGKKSAEYKLCLLAEQTELLGSAMMQYGVSKANHSEKNEEYWKGEAEHMSKRIEWLLEDIGKTLKEQKNALQGA